MPLPAGLHGFEHASGALKDWLNHHPLRKQLEIVNLSILIIPNTGGLVKRPYSVTEIA